MQAQGTRQEKAAVTLGAHSGQVFRRVALPKLQWALPCGAVLCSAHAMGEFGGVSVVSGNVQADEHPSPSG